VTAKPVPRESIPWFPAVDAAQCDGCGICIDFCPHGVYEKGGSSPAVVVRHPYQCVVGCSGCQDKCSAGAISFPELEDIAALLRRLRQG
jgi:NAD-dependent dihydropyrimidine dehydrogenase PreA subunit